MTALDEALSRFEVSKIKFQTAVAVAERLLLGGADVLLATVRQAIDKAAALGREFQAVAEEVAKLNKGRPGSEQMLAQFNAQTDTAIALLERQRP
jgi:Lhr-like helicase